jgi:hypothetical protein
MWPSVILNGNDRRVGISLRGDPSPCQHGVRAAAAATNVVSEIKEGLS